MRDRKRSRARKRNPNRQQPWTDNERSYQKRSGHKIKKTYGNAKRIREVSAEVIDDCPETGKRPFATYADAIRLRPGVHQTPYQCPHCKCWHLTTIRKDNSQ